MAVQDGGKALQCHTQMHLIPDQSQAAAQNGTTESNWPKEDPAARRNRIIKQGIKAGVASLGMWAIGVTLAYPSVMTQDLTRHNTTIFGSAITLTNTQMDLLGRTQEARAVLRNLRGPAADVDAEIEDYKAINIVATSSTEPIWRDLCKLKVLKPLLVTSTLFVLTFATGYVVIIANSSRIFRSAASSVPDNLASLVVMVVMMMSGIGGSWLMDRIGRKKSLLLSYSTMFVSLGVLTIYTALTQGYVTSGDAVSYLGEEDIEYSMGSDLTSPPNATVKRESGEEVAPYGWMPLLCLMVTEAAVVLGANPVPFILSNEYFPTRIRSLAASISFSMGMVSGFVTFLLYSPIVEHLTMAGLYGTYTLVCAIGIPFSAIFVRETAGTVIG